MSPASLVAGSDLSFQAEGLALSMTGMKNISLMSILFSGRNFFSNLEKLKKQINAFLQ